MAGAAAAGGGPDPLRQTFAALLAARAVVTATTLGVFDALAEEPCDAAALAKRLGLEPLGTDTLLLALDGLGYLEPATEAGGSAVRPTPAAAELLTRSSPSSIASFVGELNTYHWELLARLDAVLLGKAPPGWHERPAGDAMWRSYVHGLFELSRAEHDANAALVDLDDPRALLDLGGAHGAFAMAMCRRHPGLSATVLDLPASAAIGREIVAAEGMAGRVVHREADARDADLGDGLDVISAFNFLQHLPPDQARELLGRARLALRPGGRLVIGETERPVPGGSAHQMASLTGLLFYLMTGTRTYSRDELTGLLTGAGFVEWRRHPNPRSPWRVVYVARPADEHDRDHDDRDHDDRRGESVG